jgi:hypothetical protein
MLRLRVMILLTWVFYAPQQSIGATFATLSSQELRAETTKYRPCSELRKDDHGYASIERDGDASIVIAGGPSPLRQAVAALNKEYGWLVDFEEPHFTSGFDLCERGSALEVGGTNFKSSFLKANNESSSAEVEKALRKIVADPTRATIQANLLSVTKTICVSQWSRNTSRMVTVSSRESCRCLTLPFPWSADTAKSSKRLISAQKCPSKAMPKSSLCVHLMLMQNLVEGKSVPARSLLAESLETRNNMITWTLWYSRNYLIKRTVSGGVITRNVCPPSLVESN